MPGLLSLWYVYDAVTKSEPYPWLAVAVLWVILWSIGFVSLFARKVGWKAGTALVKKLTAKPGSVVPAVVETAAPAPPPPLDAPPNKLGVIEKMEEELRSADLETRYRVTVAQEQQDLELRLADAHRSRRNES